MQHMVMLQLVSGIDTFLNIVSAVLVIYALMTWFVRPDNPIYIFFARIADFIVSPFRPISSWLFGRGFRIDLSVVLALFAIRIIRSLLINLLYSMVF